MKNLLRISLAALLVLGLTSFIGCSSDDDNSPSGPSTQNYFTDVAQHGDDYLTAGTKNISGDALYQDIQNGVDLFMIDLRSATHYAELGHIAGTVNWTIADLPDNLDQIPADAKVICICYSGQNASHATAYLRMMGYDAYNLLFGMCGWTTDTNVNLGKWANLEPAGYPTETTTHTLTTEYTFPELNGASMEECMDMGCRSFFADGPKYINATALYDLLNDGDATNDPFILNYWNETDYNAGHIPGSFQFTPGQLGPEELLKYVPTDKQIVVWCYTGQTSAQVSTYLNMLGYNAYSLAYGMNGINTDLCAGHVYHPPSNDYPVVYGTAG